MMLSDVCLSDVCLSMAVKMACKKLGVGLLVVMI